MRLIGFFALLVTIIGLSEGLKDYETYRKPGPGGVQVYGVKTGCPDNRVGGPTGDAVQDAVQDVAKGVDDISKNTECGGIAETAKGALDDAAQILKNFITNVLQGGKGGLLGGILGGGGGREPGGLLS
ncbi:hypothetical protein JTE90_017892 [Oedothorax gibbosus]|uniref:Uncharacterized protein n=1 Tax=Oedothorax gibbosus TaxID=931172 RepID=A0AAV6V433_9ARAC|nr:hypothetical protein JTE90_017892 [Oedothorax gibbosus]